jgi:hypothetical protein
LRKEFFFVRISLLNRFFNFRNRRFRQKAIKKSADLCIVRIIDGSAKSGDDLFDFFVVVSRDFADINFRMSRF